MAAATVTAGFPKRDRVFGDSRFIRIKFTALANTNTYVVPGGSSVNVVGFIPIQVSTSASVTVTVSGQTLTFNVSSGTPDVTGYIVIE